MPQQMVPKFALSRGRFERSGGRNLHPLRAAPGEFLRLICSQRRREVQADRRGKPQFPVMGRFEVGLREIQEATNKKSFPRLTFRTLARPLSENVGGGARQYRVASVRECFRPLSLGPQALSRLRSAFRLVLAPQVQGTRGSSACSWSAFFSSFWLLRSAPFGGPIFRCTRGNSGTSTSSAEVTPCRGRRRALRRALDGRDLRQNSLSKRQIANARLHACEGQSRPSCEVPVPPRTAALRPADARATEERARARKILGKVR